MRVTRPPAVVPRRDTPPAFRPLAGAGSQRLAHLRFEDFLQGLSHQLSQQVAVTVDEGFRFRWTSRYAWLGWSWLLLLGEWVDWTINVLP